MSTSEQLQWVQRNRTRGERVQRAAEPVLRLARELEPAEPARTREAGAVMAAVVDDQFRAHCRVSMAGPQTLFVSVDEPGLVAGMRLRWLSALRGALSAHGCGRRVVFRFGREGMPISDCGMGRQ